MKPDEKIKHEKIKEIVQEACYSIEIPDMEEGWENIRKRLRAMRRRASI